MKQIKQAELLEHIADAIQREGTLEPNMELENLEEWDSLAIVSMIALYEHLFGLKTTGNALRECKTIADVLKIASDHIAP